MEYHSAEEADKVNWDTVQAWFARAFGSRDRKMIWRNMLNQQKLQPNASYYSDVCLLCRKLGLNVDNTCATFLTNLMEDIANVVCPQRSQTIQQAFQIACCLPELALGRPGIRSSPCLCACVSALTGIEVCIYWSDFNA